MITGFVPYLHVADVLRSQRFYELFGLALDSQFGSEGAPFWARMKGPQCDLMLARADGHVDPRVQAVLFYLYAPDLNALREHLMAHGVVDGGPYAGEGSDDFPASGKVYGVQHPHYMPSGELRVHDPDGYVLLVGQLG